MCLERSIFSNSNISSLSSQQSATDVQVVMVINVVTNHCAMHSLIRGQIKVTAPLKMLVSLLSYCIGAMCDIECLGKRLVYHAGVLYRQEANCFVIIILHNRALTTGLIQ